MKPTNLNMFGTRSLDPLPICISLATNILCVTIMGRVVFDPWFQTLTTQPLSEQQFVPLTSILLHKDLARNVLHVRLPLLVNTKDVIVRFPTEQAWDSCGVRRR